jgi:hypothetical protein
MFITLNVYKTFIKRLQNVSLQNVHFSLLGYTRLQRFISIITFAFPGISSDEARVGDIEDSDSELLDTRLSPPSLANTLDFLSPAVARAVTVGPTDN